MKVTVENKKGLNKDLKVFVKLILKLDIVMAVAEIMMKKKLGNKRILQINGK